MRGLAVMLFSGLVLTACGRTAVETAPPTAATSWSAPSASAIGLAGGGKGQAPAPADFPAAPQSLEFAGGMNAEISSGRPQSCGYGSGPDNFMVFAYGLYFEVGSAWYRFGADTDYASGPYHGPSSYSASASLGPVDGNGPTYQGRVTLTIRSDHAPDAGTVNGILTTPDGSGRVKVTGGWTCSPGPELGPA